ncbi:hypothetical protein [Sphingobium sp. WCS2017Hpa-17]|uniref:hypothetical protein n=1 Tax=Sphingobium sp. WCS2017Hpa-17 TaxID=3073638 RepID=UPI0028895C04|nr:hypothetical protein [Sphingobium sp. WCS2017Hpa-17]
MKFLRIACAFLSALSAPAWAACGTNACNNVTIVRLYVSTDNNIYVKISDNITPLNCAPLQDEYLTLRRSEPNSDAIYSMLLTSQAMNRILTRIRIVEGSGGCTVAYVWQD